MKSFFDNSFYILDCLCGMYTGAIEKKVFYSILCCIGISCRKETIKGLHKPIATRKTNNSGLIFSENLYAGVC